MRLWRSRPINLSGYRSSLQIISVFVLKFAGLGIGLLGEANGNLFPMVDQCRRAVAWVYRNAATFGGNPNEIYLCSRSSGSHLASCVLITEWEKQGLPRDILKGAVLGSGMYDLKPVRLSKRATFVKFTDDMEQQLSAQRHLDKIHTLGRSRLRHPGDTRVPAADA